MDLYWIDDVKHIKVEPFKHEKELQGFVEKNLEKILGLEFVKSEFSIEDFRFDTVAYNKDSRSFVIIEYKKKESFSVIDQGYAYLGTMLNNKAEFIVEYNEIKGANLKRKDIEWDQSRVVFIAPSYTSHQLHAVNFKDIPFELYRVTKFNNGTIAFDLIKRNKSRASIKDLAKDNSSIKKVSKEIKVYTEEDHLNKAKGEIQDLYYKLKEGILNLGDMDLKFKKLCVAFVKDKRNVVDINVQKDNLKIWINLKKGELDDPKILARDVSNLGHWGSGDYEIQLNNDENLEYILSLIKQSLRKKK